MDSDNNPSISIYGSVGENFIQGDNNQIIQQAAPKSFNDKGAFLPMAQNKLFTGREAALKELAEALRGDTNVVITQAITGMGGIGKSQLALEFSYRSLEAKDFISAHWLNLADPSQLGAEIAACGRQMGLLDDAAKQPEMVAETLRVWGLHGPRLLVLDNYESAADALQTLAPLLQVPTLRLLITARRADFPPELGLHPYALEVFTPEDSLKFLRKLVKLSNDQIPDLEKLAEKLGHLPLALHLAGHYLREEGISPTEYLRELDEVLAHESMQAAWFKEMDIASPTAHEQSLLGTFALSWQKASDETARMIFKVAGYLAPNMPIPVEIFAALLEVEEKDRALKRALRQLEKVGLFTIKDGLPIINPLLAAYARHLNGESTELLEKLAGKLANWSKKAIDQVDQTGSLTWFAPLQAHVLCTAEYAEKVDLQYAVNLYNSLAYYLQKIADYSGARSANECAIRIGEAILGKDHPDVATSVNNLGMVLMYLGDLNGARIAFERAIQVLEANLGENHPLVATCVNNLGLVLRDLGDLNGARTAFECALAMGEAAFGKDHPVIAIRVNNLGDVLREMGDLNGARAAFERALAMGEATFGKDHPTIAIRVNNLGNVLREMGDLNGARAAFERALRIDEVIFGKDHPEVATDVNNLGNVLLDASDLHGARIAYERALKITEAAFGMEHPSVAIYINNLGNVLAGLGDLDSARTAFERTVQIFEANLGENHPKVATSVLNLGTILQAQGEKERARGCYQRALAIYEQFLPAGHPNIKLTKGWLKSLEGGESKDEG